MNDFTHDGEAVDNLPGVVTFDERLGRVFRFSRDELAANSMEEFTRGQIFHLYRHFIFKYWDALLFQVAFIAMLMLAYYGMIIPLDEPGIEWHLFCGGSIIIVTVFWVYWQVKFIRWNVHMELERSVRIFSAQMKKDKRCFHLGRLTFPATRRQLAALEEDQRYTIFYTYSERIILSIEPVVKARTNLSLDELL